MNQQQFQKECFNCTNCDKIYFSQNCENCNLTRGCQECFNCYSIVFSRGLINCHHCIACEDLVDRSYCIHNKQYSKEAWQKEFQKTYWKKAYNIMRLAGDGEMPEDDCFVTDADFH